MRRLALLLLGLAAATPAAGQVVSAAPERTAVTIYRLGYALDSQNDVRLAEIDPQGGLAMIRETRTVDLPAGRSRISFRGVADTMVPQTAAVEGLPGRILERNEDYNLLTPGALIEASVGRTVQLVRTNPRTGQAVARPAVVRAGAEGPVLEVDGGFEGLGCSGAPERLVFDAIPPGLADKPTFSVLADAPEAGRYKVQLSYLATGLAWSADYVARIAPDGRSLDLVAWITLANQTSVSFAEAPTDVVAGELAHDEETVPPEFETTALDISCWPLGRSLSRPRSEERILTAYARAPSEGVIEEIVLTASKIAKLSDLGDYKLYTLPEPTTVAAKQTKQVLFLDQKAVRFERLYAYRFDSNDYDGREPPGPEPTTVLLRLKNETRAGLGKPLPAGVVAVMEPGPGGAPVLAGQWRVRDTPVGLPLDVELGRAADVQVKVTELAQDDGSEDTEWVDVEASFSNDKPVPVTVEYRQARTGDAFKVAKASRKAGAKSGDAMWTIRLGPGERTSLRYRVYSE